MSALRSAGLSSLRVLGTFLSPLPRTQPTPTFNHAPGRPARNFSRALPAAVVYTVASMNSLPSPLQQVDRKYVSYRGKRLSYFGGCDYFRLASHPNVLRAAREGLATFGLNVSASRATTGNHRLYERLEIELARFFNVETALLVPNGYITNLTVAQTLAGRFSHALLDARAHPSLADAAQLLDCPIVKFRHRDVEELGRVLRRLGSGVRPILLTE